MDREQIARDRLVMCRGWIGQKLPGMDSGDKVEMAVALDELLEAREQAARDHRRGVDMTGWICPRCSAGWAPHIEGCARCNGDMPAREQTGTLLVPPCQHPNWYETTAGRKCATCGAVILDLGRQP